MPLFEVAIIRVDDDENENLIFGPKPLLAANPERAKMKAVRSLTEKEAGDLDDLQVLVRPFSGQCRGPYPHRCLVNMLQEGSGAWCWHQWDGVRWVPCPGVDVTLVYQAHGDTATTNVPPGYTNSYSNTLTTGNLTFQVKSL